MATNLLPASPYQPAVTITIIVGEERKERELTTLIITFAHITISSPPHWKATADITPTTDGSWMVIVGCWMTGVIKFVIRRDH